MQRRLSAILSADVKGYSWLMNEDEEATICTLAAYQEVMAILMPQHQGRVEGRGRLQADEEIEKSGARLT